MNTCIKSLTIAMFAFTPITFQAAELYSVADLGVPGRTAVGANINNKGHVTFGLYAEPSIAASKFFFYDGNSSLDLREIFESHAVVNNNDTLLGIRPGFESAFEVFRYTPPGTPGLPNAVVFEYNGDTIRIVAQNDSGNSVGSAGAVSTRTAYLLTASGEFTDLGTLGGNSSIAQAINNLNQVVGVSLTAATPSEIAAGASVFEAFIFQNGTMSGLGTLGGQSSVARAINDLGQIVGDSSAPGQGSHAFLYDSSGGMRDIGPAGMQSVAYDINNSGVVVGEQYDPIALLPRRAFLFDPAGGLRYLDDLVGSQSGWTSFLSATGINDRGQIVGIGEIGGETHVFLLTPVPEPQVAMMLAIASAVVVCQRLRALKTPDPTKSLT